MSVVSAAAPADQDLGEECGLLTQDEVGAALRAALGSALTDEQIALAADALRSAQAARWEQLPKDINPDMGFNLGFLPCSETCWMGRQVLLEGATFRVFRQRDGAD